MQILSVFILGLQMTAALLMVGLILVQHGKGADMGAAFGSGGSGSLLGASGSANVLSHLTAVSAAVFFVCTLTLAGIGNVNPQGSVSVLQKSSVAEQPTSDQKQPDVSAIPAK